MEGIRTWMRRISPMDLLERRAERAAHLQELESAAREAYLKEVRADIAQNIKLTQVTWVGAWQVLMFFFWAPHQTWPQRSIKLHKGHADITIGRFGPEDDHRDDDVDDDITGFSGYGIAWQLPGRGNSSGEENEAIECQVCCGARCDARWHRWRHEPSEGFESEGNRWEASDFLF